MEMRDLDASHIGQRITISYPGSGTKDQITGSLASVAHRITGGRFSSEIAVNVADQTYVFHNVRSGKWSQELKLSSAT